MKGYFFLCAVLALGCNSISTQRNESVSKLKHQKYAVDSLISTGQLIAFFKVKGKKDLVPLERARGLKDI